tara:strand:- start:9711 stop:9905 length:195 start_codon:yes stop_codon:yes gene_type:complete
MKNYNNLAIVTFENNDVIRTEINGTIPQIQEYYKIGKIFNIGNVNDNLQPVKSLTVRKLSLKLN